MQRSERLHKDAPGRSDVLLLRLHRSRRRKVIQRDCQRIPTAALRLALPCIDQVDLDVAKDE
eukprot:40693-Eustigmatos_ZCMA.PRE.1